jgi:hypothetical protein
MPARTTTTTNGATAKANGKRFELPALEFNFKPLTEGTDIPPPPPSPIKESSADKSDENKENKNAEKKDKGVNGAAAANGPKSNGTNGTIKTTTVTAGTKRPADDLSSPLSPALSSRQGSIRRLFSRTLLNNTYAEQGEAGVNGAGQLQPNGGRPESRSNTSILDEKKAKRSSGWFRRLRSGNESNKRSSAIIVEEVNKPAGPPPPMIPELSALDSKVDVHDKGSLGADDMFKNIK